MAGDRVGSSYRLTERIGRGGMGDVWRGEGPGGPVAIKVLRADLADDDLVVARFLQERSILMAVRSPNVVTVIDLVAEGEQLAIVMELVDGIDLRAKLRNESSLLPVRAVAIAQQLLNGLTAAHAIGVVHRDVKPENVLLADGDGTGDHDVVKLADFGVARIAESASATRATGLVGTPRYLAPELARGERPTPAADVYGVGAVLYEMLFGRPPFDGDSPYSVMRAHAEDPVFRPPGASDPLWTILEQLLAKDPVARPTAMEARQSLATLARESISDERFPPLGYIAAEEPTTHDRTLGGRRAIPAEEPERVSDPAPSRRRAIRSRPVVAVTGLVVVAAVGFGAVAWSGDGGAERCVRAPKPVHAPVAQPADRIIEATDGHGQHVGMYFGSTFLGFGNRGRHGGDEAQQMVRAGAIPAGVQAQTISYPAYLQLERRPPDGVVFREWTRREHETAPRYFVSVGGAAIPVANADALRRHGFDPDRAVLIPRNALDAARYRVPADGTVFRVAGTTYVMRGGKRTKVTACRGVSLLDLPPERGRA